MAECQEHSFRFVCLFVMKNCYNIIISFITKLYLYLLNQAIAIAHQAILAITHRAILDITHRAILDISHIRHYEPY